MKRARVNPLNGFLDLEATVGDSDDEDDEDDDNGASAGVPDYSVTTYGCIYQDLSNMSPSLTLILRL